MRKTYAKQAVKCSCCPRITDTPRRGMCFACYQRELRKSSLPPAACCISCGIRDPLVLRLSPFGVLCANDLARARAAS